MWDPDRLSTEKNGLTENTHHCFACVCMHVLYQKFKKIFYHEFKPSNSDCDGQQFYDPINDVSFPYCGCCHTWRS